MISYECILQANSSIKPVNIKGKMYAEVNQRIKAFRMVYPEGKITTEIIKWEGNTIVMKAEIFDGEDKLLATGMASEKEGSNNINRTSFIENCETSAVGRALGMCGFGIDCEVASKEEVESKEESAARLEKEMEKLSVDYTKLRSTLSDMGCDFRKPEVDAWILKEAKIETQDLQELEFEGLKRLNRLYRSMIAKKKDEEIQKNNEKIIEEAGGF